LYCVSLAKSSTEVYLKMNRCFLSNWLQTQSTCSSVHWPMFWSFQYGGRPNSTNRNSMCIFLCTQPFAGGAEHM